MDSNTRNLNRITAARSTFESEPSCITAHIRVVFITLAPLYPPITSQTA
jgi:hypothetical protein